MTNGSSLLLADEGMIKNDDKKQNQCFSVFLFKVNYAKGSCGSICVCPTIRYLQHVYSEKISFRPSTFNRDAFFRVRHVT